MERSSRVLATISLDEAFEVASVTNITPGYYRVRLETGCELWSMSLDDRDLVWTSAFPNRPINLAAATAGAARPSTHDATLLGGRLRLSVFPGFETGTIAIVWNVRVS